MKFSIPFLVSDFLALSAEQRAFLVRDRAYSMRWIGTGREESAEEYIERKGMRLLWEENGYHFCASSEDMYGDPVEDENGDLSEEEMVVVVIEGYYLDLEARDAP